MNELTERDKALIIDGIPEANLVLYCPGLQGRGATLLDRSRYANHGTLNGATWKRLPRGLLVLDFNGTNAWVSVPTATSLNPTTAITLEAWVYPHTASDQVGSQVIFFKGSGTSGYMLWWDQQADARKLTFYIGDNTAAWRKCSNPDTLAANAWYHILATFDGLNMRLYVNSSLVATTGVTTSIVGTATNLEIGSADVGTTSLFDGVIGEVRVYGNKALSATEILRHYTRERLLFGV